MSMYKFLECTVAEFMTSPVRSVLPSMKLDALDALFDSIACNGFPVVDDAGGTVGMVTKLDFLKAFQFTTRQMVPRYEELMQKTVADVMTQSVVSVEPTAPLTRALQLMVDLKARSFPVIDRDGTLVGIIAREDIMRALKTTVGGKDV